MYKKAFLLTDSEDPNIGYTLAEKLLKEKKFIESFKICKTVLEKFPKFKKI